MILLKKKKGSRANNVMLGRLKHTFSCKKCAPRLSSEKQSVFANESVAIPQKGDSPKYISKDFFRNLNFKDFEIKIKLKNRYVKLCRSHKTKKWSFFFKIWDISRNCSELLLTDKSSKE